MVDIAEHTERLRALFRDEARELFEAIHSALRGIEAADDVSRAEAFGAALRAAHSIKGGAAISGMSTLHALVHNWESCVAALAKGATPLDRETGELVLRTIDAASDELEHQCGGEVPARADPNAVVAELTRRFGPFCEIRVIEGEAGAPNPSAKKNHKEPGTVRVQTQKLDRQMASVEELLRLKVGGEDRISRMTQNLAAFEALTSRLAELRRVAGTEVGAKNGQPRQNDVKRVANGLAELLSAIERAVGEYSAVFFDARQATHALSLLADSLHADVRAVRMLPVEAPLSAFSRMVRELGRANGKVVSLEVDGGATEVDRDVLEAVKDPIMHLLRNAVDHGIESPEERRRAGKPEDARIVVRARGSAGMLEVEVSDDGRGISAEVVGSAAVDRKIISRADLARMDDDAVRVLVFHEGFSTSAVVSEISGRGVGLAIVRRAVERIGGRVTLTTREGQGTAFRLVLPLNLATSRLLLVRTGDEVFAVPALSVERIVRLELDQLTQVDHGFAFELEGKAVPVFRLSDALGVPETSRAKRALAVILATASERGAFIVDRVTDEQELVARSLGEHLSGVPNVAGVAVLADGALVPILAPAELLQNAERLSSGSALTSGAPERALARRILVVDDSLTTRTLEKSILEAAGYDVEVAVDGSDALGRLGQRDFDLVLSDVQMPRLDGVSLVRAVKKDSRLNKIPFVLVSSLDTEEHRREGLDAGADAYLSKAEFEQGLLLSTLERFI
jgi:two-component system chemotaxis sensor kinase CheA